MICLVKGCLRFAVIRDAWREGDREQRAFPIRHLLGAIAPLRKVRGRWRDPQRRGSGLQPRCGLASWAGASRLKIAPTTAAVLGIFAAKHELLGQGDWTIDLPSPSLPGKIGN
jgi:hypothetical protein